MQYISHIIYSLIFKILIMSREIISSIKNIEISIKKIMERYYIILKQSQFKFKKYQYDGVEWCVKNELNVNPIENIRGGIVADEMGLGKTMMMISVMFVNLLPRTLIVVPSVLIQQWFKEILISSGHQALLYYGNNKKNITLSDIKRVPIILTTYNTLLPEDCILKNIVWNRVVFDEAHHLRNNNTKRYKSCQQIKSRIRWLVTGTPVQNKIHDFYNLCYAIGIKPLFYKNNANFRIIEKHFILRRTKDQIGILLPPVNKNNQIVTWKNKKEMMLSEEIHALLPNQTKVSKSNINDLSNIFNSKGKCKGKDKGKGKGKGKGTLIFILRARQSCVLPSLMRKNIEMFCNSEIRITEYLEALKYSSKIDAVIDLMLERKDNLKGKIVFCNYKNEIDVIEQRLIDGGFNKVVKYDGRNSGGKNLASLSEPADALVIQIQSGCEGLNLQNNFSEIYFVSPHWNPFVEDQAIARCHRIGQVNPVNVFKFEMGGFVKDQDAEFDPISLEKYINKIQDAKRIISKKILEPLPI